MLTSIGEVTLDWSLQSECPYPLQYDYVVGYWDSSFLDSQ